LPPIVPWRSGFTAYSQKVAWHNLGADMGIQGEERWRCRRSLIELKRVSVFRESPASICHVSGIQAERRFERYWMRWPLPDDSRVDVLLIQDPLKSGCLFRPGAGCPHELQLLLHSNHRRNSPQGRSPQIGGRVDQPLCQRRIPGFHFVDNTSHPRPILQRNLPRTGSARIGNILEMYSLPLEDRTSPGQ